MNILNIEHIHKIFGDKVIFDDISCGIDQGEKIGIIGVNGTGKTTLLRVIAGEEEPDEGQVITQNGIRISWLPQTPEFPQHMTILDYVAEGKWQKDWSTESEARRMLNTLGITDQNSNMDNLSGGEKKRVALARMMIGEPEAILLDEPFSALDGFLKDVLQREMQDFLKDYPGDMILVTHSRDEAYKFCKELSVVDGGRILVTDETKRLFENPRMLKAAKLTGCKNFSAVQRLGEHEIYATDWKMKLHTAEKVAEDITHVGIRGHWIRPEEKPGENCLEVQVDEYIETTFEHQYMIRKKDEEAAAGLWWMRPKNSFMEDPDMGLPKYLYLPPEHLMLLK